MTDIDLDPIRIGLLSPEDAYMAILDATDINNDRAFQLAGDALTSVAWQLMSARAPKDIARWMDTFRRVALLAGFHAPEVRDRIKALTDLLAHRKQFEAEHAKEQFMENSQVAEILRFLAKARGNATLAEISGGTTGNPHLVATLLAKLAGFGVVERDGYGLEAKYCWRAPYDVHPPATALLADATTVSQPTFTEIDEDIYPWGKPQ